MTLYCLLTFIAMSLTPCILGQVWWPLGEVHMNYSTNLRKRRAAGEIFEDLWYSRSENPTIILFFYILVNLCLILMFFIYVLYLFFWQIYVLYLFFWHFYVLYLWILGHLCLILITCHPLLCSTHYILNCSTTTGIEAMIPLITPFHDSNTNSTILCFWNMFWNMMMMMMMSLVFSHAIISLFHKITKSVLLHILFIH